MTRINSILAPVAVISFLSCGTTAAANTVVSADDLSAAKKQYVVRKVLTAEVKQKYGANIETLVRERDLANAALAQANAELETERAARTANDAKIARLEEEVRQRQTNVNDANQNILDILRSLDPLVAQAIDIQTQAAEDWASEPNGPEIIQLLNAGKSEEARTLSDKTYLQLEADRNRREDVRSALEEKIDKSRASDSHQRYINKKNRAYGFLYVSATSTSISDFESLTLENEATSEDWATLSYLYHEHGDHDKSLAAARKAHVLAESTFAKAIRASKLAESLIGRNPEATNEAIRLLDTALSDANTLSGFEKRSALQAVHRARAEAFKENNDLDNAKRASAEYLKIVREIEAQNPVPYNTSLLLIALLQTGEILSESEDLEQAAKHIAEAIDKAMELKSTHPSTEISSILGSANLSMALIKLRMRDYGGAEPYIKNGLKEYEDLHTKDNTVGRYDLNIQYAHRLYSSVNFGLNRFYESLEEIDKALYINRDLFNRFPNTYAYSREYVTNLNQKISMIDRIMMFRVAKDMLEELTSYRVEISIEQVNLCRHIIKTNGDIPDVHQSLADALYFLADHNVEGFTWKVVAVQYDEMARLKILDDSGEYTRKSVRSKAKN